jgi:RecT family
MIDVAEIEKRVDRAITQTVPVHRSIAGVSAENLGQLTEMAKLMSVSKTAVPPYLRANPGDCLAIILRALRWQMDPFFVAEKSYAVSKGGVVSVAFESQLIHAVVETLAPLKGRLRHEIIGEGDQRRCKVWGTFKGETKPHEFTSETLGKRIEDIGFREKENLDQDGNKTTASVFKGSPLWLTKPEVQMFYDASRDWARLYCPAVLGGAYSRDELDVEPVDITPKPLDDLAQRLRDAKKARVDQERGFDVAHVERVGASIIAGDAQEADHVDDTAGPGRSSEDTDRSVGDRDKKGGAVPRQASKTMGGKPARQKAARTQDQGEKEPGLPFPSSTAKKEKGKQR